ncbi:MAG: hypothetical protein K5884_11580 [Ruminococcus sp.]|uniref:hypothetical protein n=1 Tax=uncultured Ruminococcus sp. TaxID=165186 RepID=UPI001563D886|nr:hypothetical protein [uncultured Ruminococcus sp.]MCR4863228.1 hypothetical protein [Ruminococcus sp.]
MKVNANTEITPVKHKKESSVYIKFACITAAAGLVTAAVGGVPYVILEYLVH